MYNLNFDKYKKVWGYVWNYNTVLVQRKLKIFSLMNKKVTDDLNGVEKMIYEFFIKDKGKIELIVAMEDNHKVYGVSPC